MKIHVQKTLKDENFKVTIRINGNYLYLNFPQENVSLLEQHISKKFSYKLKEDGSLKEFYNPKTKQLNIGFLESLKKTLNDYCAYQGRKLILNIIDTRIFNRKLISMPDKLLTGKVLRDYQQTAIDTYLNSNPISILEISTGGGKTLIMTEILRILSMPCLFVIDKRDLMYQTKQVFEEELGIEVGIIGDGKKDIKDINVATIQTLVNNLDTLKYYLASVRFVMFDEVQKIAADSYAQLCYHLKNTQFRLSVSATAKRDDGNDMWLQANGGDIVYSLTGQNLIEDGHLMKPNINFMIVGNDFEELQIMEETANNNIIGWCIEKYNIATEKLQRFIDNTLNKHLKYKFKYEQFIVHNKKRNSIILEQCCLNNGKIILILVKLIEHGKILEKIIPGAVYVHGSTNKKVRANTLADFKLGKQKVLISTIGIFAEGVDIPKLDIVINAAANTGSIKTIQTLGRVLRKSVGKNSATYIDFLDDYKTFNYASKARIRAFKKEGHKVNIIT